MDKCDICNINILEKSKYLKCIEKYKDFFILKISKNKILLENEKKICLRCIYKKNNIK
jgi:hypothetical protein